MADLQVGNARLLRLVVVLGPFSEKLVRAIECDMHRIQKRKHIGEHAVGSGFKLPAPLPVNVT